LICAFCFQTYAAAHAWFRQQMLRAVIKRRQRMPSHVIRRLIEAHATAAFSGAEHHAKDKHTRRCYREARTPRRPLKEGRSAPPFQPHRQRFNEQEAIRHAAHELALVTPPASSAPLTSRAQI
jgi:hypothetical protein